MDKILSIKKVIVNEFITTKLFYISLTFFSKQKKNIITNTLFACFFILTLLKFCYVLCNKRYFS